MNYDSMSKFISLILRHKPEIIGIKLDKHGWASVNDLIDGIQKEKGVFTFEQLCAIVETDKKQRYSFNEDRTKIRANQGHSVNVDVELENMSPPDVLYHGTSKKFVHAILTNGLLPMSRLYVHLSKDIETAVMVGKRRGAYAVIAINAKEMAKDGYEFFKSKNNVWLTKKVPTKYIVNAKVTEG